MDRLTQRLGQQPLQLRLVPGLVHKSMSNHTRLADRVGDECCAHEQHQQMPQSSEERELSRCTAGEGSYAREPMPSVPKHAQMNASARLAQ